MRHLQAHLYSVPSNITGAQICRTFKAGSCRFHLSPSRLLTSSEIVVHQRPSFLLEHLLPSIPHRRQNHEAFQFCQSSIFVPCHHFNRRSDSVRLTIPLVQFTSFVLVQITRLQELSQHHELSCNPSTALLVA